MSKNKNRRVHQESKFQLKLIENLIALAVKINENILAATHSKCDTCEHTYKETFAKGGIVGLNRCGQKPILVGDGLKKCNSHP